MKNNFKEIIRNGGYKGLSACFPLKTASVKSWDPIWAPFGARMKKMAKREKASCAIKR